MSLPKPILQIEPTDYCNLKCTMCSPQHRDRPHVSSQPGFMDMALYENIIDGLARNGPDLDHVILQWLGEPTLHPRWLDMVEMAVARAGHRFGYFRIDTNCLNLDKGASSRLCSIARRHPGRPMVLVFSLDAASRKTYMKIKGRDEFERVTANIECFLRYRKEMVDLSESPLNVQFQLVLQEGNASEVGAFVSRWDDFLAELGTEHSHDSIMIKRLAVGTGGPGQRKADDLYDETVKRLRLKPGRLKACTLELWLDRPWEET